MRLAEGELRGFHNCGTNVGQTVGFIFWLFGSFHFEHENQKQDKTDDKMIWQVPIAISKMVLPRSISIIKMAIIFNAGLAKLCQKRMRYFAPYSLSQGLIPYVINYSEIDLVF